MKTRILDMRLEMLSAGQYLTVGGKEGGRGREGEGEFSLITDVGLECYFIIISRKELRRENKVNTCYF